MVLETLIREGVGPLVYGWSLLATKLLYMDDSYLKEFDATITDVRDRGIILDRTAFYPRGGGLVSDTGVIIIPNTGNSYAVKEVVKDRDTGEVIHVLDNYVGLSRGLKVKGRIDWDRRYRIMRIHTGLHVLISLFNQKAGVLVTGNQVAPETSRVDLNLERPDKDFVLGVFEEANRIIKERHPVKIYYLEREEAMRIPGIVKLAKAAPPNLRTLRIVEIEGIDIQADGGPHVMNTGEIGELVFLKMVNKGRNNRRVYFTVKP